MNMAPIIAANAAVTAANTTAIIAANNNNQQVRRNYTYVPRSANEEEDALYAGIGGVLWGLLITVGVIGAGLLLWIAIGG